MFLPSGMFGYFWIAPAPPNSYWRSISNGVQQNEMSVWKQLCSGKTQEAPWQGLGNATCPVYMQAQHQTFQTNYMRPQ